MADPIEAMMPRRRKPPGYEKWTWAEINAGLRMSKAEKRWNRMAKGMNWDQRSDGSYQAPPQAVPFLVILLVLMFALCIVAPNGAANTKGEAGAVAAIITPLGARNFRPYVDPLPTD